MVIPRYKRAQYLVASVAIATGLAAVLLWPQLKKLVSGGTISAGTPTLKRPDQVAGYLQALN